MAFDEVSGIEFSDSTAVQMLKDYMESGSYSGDEMRPRRRRPWSTWATRTSPPEVLVKTSHLFADLPQAMIDAAFLDRLHFYLPGWDVPKMEQRFFTSHFDCFGLPLGSASRAEKACAQRCREPGVQPWLAPQRP